MAVKHKINLRALYLLLFLVGMYGIMALVRNGKDSKEAVPDNWYRTPTPLWSERSICQVECLGLSDSNTALVIQYGQVNSRNGHSVVLSGRTFRNEELRVHLSYIGKNSLVDSLQLVSNTTHCPCP